MNDNDIIKALERCIKCNDKQIAGCDGCLLEKYYPYCDDELEIMCLDLINRQKTEIADERARKELCAEVIARQDKEIEMLKSSIKEINDCLSEGDFAKGITLIIRLVEYIDN